MAPDVRISTSVFKECGLCGMCWTDRDQFLTDPHVVAAGYVVSFEELKSGLFLFNHSICGNTLSVRAGEFTDLYDGPVFKTRRTGLPECPAHCLRKDDLAPCPGRCECAYVRAVLDKVVHWPKTKA